MDAVIIITSQKHSKDELLSRLRGYEVREEAPGVTAIVDEAGHVYLARDDSIADDMDPSELDLVLKAVSKPIFYLLEFSDIRMCRDVLLAIVDDCGIMVSNDHGVTLSGPDFLNRLRSDPTWDWRDSHS